MNTEAEANLTDQRAPLSHAQCIEIADLIASLRADVARHKADYEGACKTIADMHAAAVGGIRGPIRGVVEDVADLRAELTATESLVSALQEQMSRLAEQSAKAVAEAVAEAREEQRELCWRVVDRWFASMPPPNSSPADLVRATPLDSTPLADALATARDNATRVVTEQAARIVELETQLRKSQVAHIGTQLGAGKAITEAEAERDSLKAQLAEAQKQEAITEAKLGGHLEGQMKRAQSWKARALAAEAQRDAMREALSELREVGRVAVSEVLSKHEYAYDAACDKADAALSASTPRAEPPDMSTVKPINLREMIETNRAVERAALMRVAEKVREACRLEAWNNEPDAAIARRIEAIDLAAIVKSEAP